MRAFYLLKNRFWVWLSRIGFRLHATASHSAYTARRKAEKYESA